VNPLRCRDVAAHASDAVDAALPAWERVLVGAHNLFCRNCRTYFAQMRDTARALQEAPRPTLPESNRRDLLERLKKS
jgi:predicted anti-sigma-YlaC factor YlaD